jgi:hypothetical protein
MLPRNQRQEALSRAYVRAVAAQAGVAVSDPESDYGIDMMLRAVTVRDGRRRDVGPQIDLQIKSTTRADVGETHLTYDLPVVNYDDLREADASPPRWLVVLVMPDDEALWLGQSPEELTLRHCAYWLSLAGQPATTSTSTVRVTLPLVNVFSPAALHAAIRSLLARRSR